ncbi:MAG: ferrous iron transport protein B [Bacteroidales bacterium]|nr:ferrous iron transport protein B [Bacteroidales bacterium]
MVLKDLETGKSAVIEAVGGEGASRMHLLSMGLIPGAKVKVVKRAPMGDPVELQVRGFALSLRAEDAAKITIHPLEKAAIEASGKAVASSCTGVSSCGACSAPCPFSRKDFAPSQHPGLGEGGKYHSKDHENPLPEGTQLLFALAGQQNCGKTTLFNLLTGSNQHVGNFPGVTVDRKTGEIRHHPGTSIVDLPGIYSLTPYTEEELVSREFILDENTRGIINLADAGNIERSLYLTLQLMTLDVPMVLALNMMDELEGNGGSIRINELEDFLGIPVVGISAARNEGIEEMLEHAIHVARYQETPSCKDYCDENDYGGAVHNCLHAVMGLIGEKARAAHLPTRFAATKLLEGDPWVESRLDLSEEMRRRIEALIVEMERKRGLDRAAAIADMRYTFIRKICRATVVKPRESREYVRSRRMDKVLTGKWTALPIFVAVMLLIIYLTIDVLGAPLQALLQSGIDALGSLTDGAMAQADVAPFVRSLVTDALFGGVGTVVSFVPVIVILFFFLSMLEDSGYMARVAFVTDHFLRKLGLSGRSIVPLLIGLGCSVPAVVATRTLPSSRDRLKTILLIPFMSCSAKIPIYAFFITAFFPHHGGLVLCGLYLLGILTGILVALVSKKMERSEAAPFIMELPNYRWPQLRNVGLLLWDKTKDFLQRAFSVILLATLIIWLLQTLDVHFNMVENGQGSMLARVAGWLTPLFAPLGLDDWRVVTAFISGFLAKESVVSTLGVLGVLSSMTVLKAVPMLIFSLLYTPCVATIATVRAELGGKWALFMIVFQCVLAWVVAYLGYQLASLLV